MLWSVGTGVNGDAQDATKRTGDRQRGSRDTIHEDVKKEGWSDDGLDHDGLRRQLHPAGTGPGTRAAELANALREQAVMHGGGRASRRYSMFQRCVAPAT